MKKIKYTKLNSKQKETYNFQKVSAVLADYGFATIKLNDDWQGADFIAQHVDGETYLKVQLKSRLTFDKKYIGKNLFICFPYKNHWFLYDHDKLLNLFLIRNSGQMGETSSWKEKGIYSWNSLSTEVLNTLDEFIL